MQWPDVLLEFLRHVYLINAIINSRCISTLCHFTKWFLYGRRCNTELLIIQLRVYFSRKNWLHVTTSLFICALFESALWSVCIIWTYWCILQIKPDSETRQVNIKPTTFCTVVVVNVGVENKSDSIIFDGWNHMRTFLQFWDYTRPSIDPSGSLDLFGLCLTYCVVEETLTSEVRLTVH